MTTQSEQEPTLLAFALMTSVLSLTLALMSQYGFGLHPCELCLAQRVPYGVVIILSVIGVLGQRWRRVLLILTGLLFLAGSGIAFYHAAVEKHWIQGPSACTSSDTGGQESEDDFLKKIENAPIVACDQPQWQFHGVTMAGMNAVWSLSLALVIFCALQQTRTVRHEHA